MTVQEKTPFKFAIITDTHLSLPAGGDEGLYSTQALASLRVRYVLQQLINTEPDFVIHLGDMIHPVPGLPEYDPTAEDFLRMFSQLDCPLYTIPGNHDLGDKSRPGMPAAVVNQESVENYLACFGPSYQAFEYKGCHFVLINSPVLNSGLPIEEKQREWLEEELAQSSGDRIFLLSHYPIYLCDPGETEHYDNLDEPARSLLLDLIIRHNVEAVFAGHVHNFFYNRHGNTDLYTLPSVMFVRQDYSEMFRLGPAADYGRNDLDKLGFFMVTVNQEGHSVQFVPTGGKTLEALNPAAREKPSSLVVPDPRGQPFSGPLGADMRHPWVEVVEVPYNYILDEFVRRRVRNDYPIFAMLQMGIQKLRIPLGDLLDPGVRSRMEALQAKGFQFQVFCFYPPQGSDLEGLIRFSSLVDALEVILLWEDVPDVIPHLRVIKERTGIRVHLSKLSVSQSFEESFDQYIRPGFRLKEREAIRAFLANEDISGAVDGFTFRVGFETDPWDEILAIANFSDDAGCHASVEVQQASDSEAGVVEDDLLLARRVAVAAAAASNAQNLDVFLDTFVDMDRGYYIRNGLVDRRFNLRPSGCVLRNLSAILATLSPVLGIRPAQVTAFGRCYQWETQDHFITLLASDSAAKHTSWLSLPGWDSLESAGKGICYDLLSGVGQQIQWRREGIDEVVQIVFAPTTPISDLVLFLVEK